MSPTASEPPSDEPTEPTEPTEPDVPDAMANEDKAGAKAFVTYYWAMVDYAQVTGEARKLRRLAYPTCAACTGGIDGLVKEFPRIQTVSGGGTAVQNAEVTPLRAEEQRLFQVDFTIKNARQVITFKNGKREIHGAGSNRYQFVVSLDDQGEWRVGMWEFL
ncbi:MAG: DUF6318 family protein [Nocardioides sp.]|nr:DUF6318 family protein [Nocardioides sp.]